MGESSETESIDRGFSSWLLSIIVLYSVGKHYQASEIYFIDYTQSLRRSALEAC